MLITMINIDVSVIVVLTMMMIGGGGGGDNNKYYCVGGGGGFDNDDDYCVGSGGGGGVDNYDDYCGCDGSINQSGALLFSLCDHDLRASQSLDVFSTPVTLPTFSHFTFPFNIFIRFFFMLRFLSTIPTVTRCSSFSIFISWQKVSCLEFMNSMYDRSCVTVSFWVTNTVIGRLCFF